MVETTDLAQASALWAQHQQYQNALKIFEFNPHISAFTLEGEADPEATQRSVTVSAEGIVTPPQMLTGIKTQIEARLKSIEAELGKLGVTV